MNTSPATELLSLIRESAQRAQRATNGVTDYLVSGGLFNPECAIHDNVRDLLMFCRDTSEDLPRLTEALEGLVKAMTEFSSVINYVGFEIPHFGADVKERADAALSRALVIVKGEK